MDSDDKKKFWGGMDWGAKESTTVATYRVRYQPRTAGKSVRQKLLIRAATIRNPDATVAYVSRDGVRLEKPVRGEVIE